MRACGQAMSWGMFEDLVHWNRICYLCSTFRENSSPETLGSLHILATSPSVNLHVCCSKVNRELSWVFSGLMFIWNFTNSVITNVVYRVFPRPFQNEQKESCCYHLPFDKSKKRIFEKWNLPLISFTEYFVQDLEISNFWHFKNLGV